MCIWQKYNIIDKLYGYYYYCGVGLSKSMRNFESNLFETSVIINDLFVSSWVFFKFDFVILI